MLTIGESILRTINNRRNLGDKKYFHWSFPRQVGATTLLGQIAIIRSLSEDTRPKILFVTTNENTKKDLVEAFKRAGDAVKTEFDITVVSGNGNNLHRIRGLRYKYIFLDNPVLNGESFAALYPLISLSEFTLHIDTTEG